MFIRVILPRSFTCNIRILIAYLFLLFFFGRGFPREFASENYGELKQIQRNSRKLRGEESPNVTKKNKSKQKALPKKQLTEVWNLAEGAYWQKEKTTRGL